MYRISNNIKSSHYLPQIVWISDALVCVLWLQEELPKEAVEKTANFAIYSRTGHFLKPSMSVQPLESLYLLL
jgi:hypothetical protein